jgi:hypothetical protein
VRVRRERIHLLHATPRVLPLTLHGQCGYAGYRVPHRPLPALPGRCYDDLQSLRGRAGENGRIRYFHFLQEQARGGRAMTTIFISYRRDDSRYQAQRIYEALRRVLPRERLFMDIDSIPPGADFVETLERWVSECRSLLFEVIPLPLLFGPFS